MIPLRSPTTARHSARLSPAVLGIFDWSEHTITTSDIIRGDGRCSQASSAAPNRRLIDQETAMSQNTRIGSNPSGLCECGCGQPTKPARNTQASRGIVRGQPQRFIYGHQRRKTDSTLTFVPANPAGLCLCGCGERTPLAKQSDHRKGWTKGEPVKYAPGHDHKARAARNKATQRVAVDPETGCWNWQGTIDDQGYGRVYQDKRVHAAHRLYYRKYLGPIPAGKIIDHLCRNRRCVNPAHLEAVTIAENTRRASRIQLTAAQRQEIKRLGQRVPLRSLARRFCVTEQIIQRIRNGPE